MNININTVYGVYFVAMSCINIFFYLTNTVGGEVLYKFADEKEKERHRDKEASAMMEMFSKYKSQCGKRKVMLICH